LPGAVPFTAPGQLGNYLRANPNNATNVYAVDRFMNLGGLKVRTYTLNGSYELPTTAYGTFAVTLGTIFDSFEFQALPTRNSINMPVCDEWRHRRAGNFAEVSVLHEFRLARRALERHLANTFASSTTDIGAGGIVFETANLKPMPVASYSAGTYGRVYRKLSTRRIGKT